MVNAANLDTRLVEIDDLADQLADAVAAPHYFWLGAGRAIPGDKRHPVQESRFDEWCLGLRHRMIACASDLSDNDLLAISANTKGDRPRADALEIISNDRSRRNSISDDFGSI